VWVGKLLLLSAVEASDAPTLFRPQGGPSPDLDLLPSLPDYSRDDFDRVFHFVE